MEFHEWPSLYDAVRREGDDHDADASIAEFYAGAAARELVRSQHWSVRLLFDAEAKWFKEGRPYYSVYPSIVEPLLRLRLDLDAGLVPRPPLPAFIVRFAKGKELDCAPGRRAKGMLLTDMIDKSGMRRLLAWNDCGAVWKGSDGRESPDVRLLALPLVPGKTLEELIQGQGIFELAGRVDKPNLDAELTTMLKLACTLWLLGDDPEILEPDVLAKDRAKWTETRDPAIVERARRRGKRGWLVGAGLEVIPHVRRPHVGLRWTGPGGQIPRIVPVKGSIVHREKVNRLPTGRLDEETGPASAGATSAGSPP
jgi:hypothetical protein